MRETWNAAFPPIPTDLCGNRDDHEPHLIEHVAAADGPMFCHADQTKRLPYAAEQRR